MARNITTGLKDRTDARLFASPVALAFVRRAVLAGVPVADARRRYQEFIRRPHALRDRRAA